MKEAIVIKPTAIFQQPYPVVAGHIIVAPPILPRDVSLSFFLVDGREKRIVLRSEMTTSAESLRQNLHGFTYSGDLLEESDLAGDALMSNLPYAEARHIYNHYQKSSS